MTKTLISGVWQIGSSIKKNRSDLSPVFVKALFLSASLADGLTSHTELATEQGIDLQRQCGDFPEERGVVHNLIIPENNFLTKLKAEIPYRY